MAYRTTRQTDQDIIDIYLRGAEAFGIDQAEDYQAGLVTTFGRLSERPHIARERTEFTPPVRMHPWRSHLIIYAERDGDILIIRVLHGRQDWERHL